MKTIDEVIKALEWCTDGDQSGCGACPYHDHDDFDCDKDADALHYLKEYQKILPLMQSLINTAIAVQKKGKTIG